MVFSARVKVLRFILCSSLYLQTFMCFGTCTTQDQTSSCPNTLSDDADDIQRQLDNEARDRIKFGRPKTIWVLHLPTARPRKYNSELDYPAHPSQWGATTFPVLKQAVKVKTFLKTPGSEVKATLKKPYAEVKEQFKCSDIKVKAYLKQANCSKQTPPKKLCKYKLPNEDGQPVAWDYKGQANWEATYPECAGVRQSPVDLPKMGLQHAGTEEELVFCNFQAMPYSMTLKSDGQRIILSGTWAERTHPLLYGGTVECRRYWFHSLVLHWPSEHTVDGYQYPLEAQALFVSDDYKDCDEAMIASDTDPQAMLGVVSFYKYGNHTEPGLKSLVTAATCGQKCSDACLAKPLAHFVPALAEYASYQGSLPVPPCTEAVLWLVRGRALPVTREDVARANCILSANGQSIRGSNRLPQPLNMRDMFYHKKVDTVSVDFGGPD